MKKRLLLGAVLLAAAAGGAAQDAERGRRLFVDTRGATGRPVGNCVACHANREALRGMIDNRGGRTIDRRSVAAVLREAIDGSVPGAKNAKAQYRDVLTARDVDDLAAYIVQARAS
jgi:mono/diheme cytochrome c family protein